MRSIFLFPLISCLAVAADPASVHLVTSDIDNFWRAYDMSTPENRRDVFQREYLDKGSPGLKDFLAKRIESADNLAKQVEHLPKFYRSMRPATLRIAGQTETIRRYFRRLQELYREAVFVDVYFVIGVANSGGTTSDRGLLIGAEMLARAPETDESELNPWLKSVVKPVEEVPVIVIHELVHREQKSRSSNVLLDQSLREGAADFISQLVTGRTINEHVRQWAEPRREQLFQEFAEKAHGQNFKGWLYDGERSTDRPADLGYWIGAEIAGEYYQRATDKKTALREIVELKDPAKIWRGTQYAKLLESQ
ncbi:MAG TPA: hypothetical protein VGV35_03465 [Bryobacteraceae bacterium]|nr:hypothetical protein [Bryobacteraceae bacterium]